MGSNLSSQEVHKGPQNGRSHPPNTKLLLNAGFGEDEIATLTGIEEIEMYSASDADVERLSNFVTLHKTLLYLNLPLAEISDQSLAVLGRFVGLQALGLSGATHLSGKGLSVLLSLGELRRLDVSYSSIDVRNLAECYGHPRLQILDIGYCRSTAHCDEAATLVFPSLTSLSLKGNIIPRKLISAISETCPNIVRLDIGNTTIDEWAQLKPFVALSGLVQVHAAGIGCSSSILESFLSQVRLEVLDVSDCAQVEDDCVFIIGAMFTLRSLNLSRCRRVSLTALRQLKALAKLSHLFVEGVLANDQQLESLANELPWCKVIG